MVAKTQQKQPAQQVRVVVAPKQRKTVTPRRPVFNPRNPIVFRPIGSAFTVTSGHDDRRDYGRHGAVDLAPTSDNDFIPALAVNSGRVIGTNVRPDYGLFLDLLLDTGEIARYAHLNSFSVERGQRVEPGDILGNVGSTGDSSGRHLHFELRTGLGHGQTIDPLALITGLADNVREQVESFVPGAREQQTRYNVPIGKPERRLQVPVQGDSPFVGSDLIDVQQTAPGQFTPAQTVGIAGFERTQDMLLNASLTDQQTGNVLTGQFGGDPLGIQAAYENIKEDIESGYEQIGEDISEYVNKNIGFVAVAVLAIIVGGVAVYGIVK